MCFILITIFIYILVVKLYVVEILVKTLYVRVNTTNTYTTFFYRSTSEKKLSTNEESIEQKNELLKC